MAKRNKKSQSNNELDAILEQLKKNYASNSFDDLEDSLLETPEDEEDEEINSILNKIFSSEGSAQKNNKSDALKEDADIAFESDTTVDAVEPEGEENGEGLTEQNIVAHEDSAVEVETETAESKDDKLDGVQSAQNEVDDVLSVMLGRVDANTYDDNKDKNFEEISVIDEIVEDTFAEDIENDSFEDDGVNEVFEDDEDSYSEDELGDNCEDDFEYVDEENVIEVLDADEEFAVADEEYDVSGEDEAIENETVEDDSNPDDIIEAADTEDEIVAESTVNEITPTLDEEIEQENSDNPEETPEPIVENEEKVCLLVLSPDEYTNDPLQEGLAMLGGVHNTKYIKTIDAGSNESKGNDNIHLDDSDISLLLKLGYDDEIRAEVGENVTEQILADRDSHFSPEAHKKPFGFCGKEFTDRAQTKEIKEKYRNDKKACLLRLIGVGVISVVILSLYGFFEFFSDRTSYPLVMLVELLLVALIAVVLNKKLYSGILGIFKFEANLYSLPVFIFFAYLIYDVVILLFYTIKKGDVDNSSLMLFGVVVVFYAILTLVADLLNCIREANTFDLITSKERVFTAEKSGDVKMTLSSNEKSTVKSKLTKLGDNTYKICDTSMISGYFRKTTQSKIGSANLIYLLGIVPVLSLIIGCISALAGGNIINGASTVMFTAMLCTPLVYVFMSSVNEFIIAKKLKREDIAVIGTVATERYIKTEALIFKDTDAVEITAFKEIHPNNSAEIEKYLVIAREVFESLGGTLAKLSENDEDNESKVIINEITESGVELYFNESINIIMGNKQYMHTHKIKVKTDANLNAATKGADCSVIYMAFDGVPRLGFILNSKIKSEFTDTSSLMDKSGIRILVESYEPHVNDVFFEQNKSENTFSVSVIRPDEYEASQKRRICDGDIVSSRYSLNVARAIAFTHKIHSSQKRNRRLYMVLVGAGLLMSCLLALLINVTDSFAVFEWLKAHISLVFNISMLLGIIPGVANVIKLEKERFD